MLADIMTDHASHKTVAATGRMAPWIEEGRRLRDAIIAERLKLLQRLTELDAEMAMLPKQVRGEVVLPLDASIFQGVPEMVRNQLKVAGPRGMTAKEILAALEEMGGGCDESNVHSALSRGVKRGEFTRNGRRGSATYRLA